MTRYRYSIIVPTHDRPESLRRCLEALAAQEYPRDRFEVIVVDDGSARPQTAEQAGSRDLQITHLYQPRSGPASARNHGARAARGQYLAFTDDDCRPEAGWLRALDRAHSGSPGAMVTGPVVNGRAANPYAVANAALIGYVTRYFRENNSRLSFYTSNNMAVPRARFLGIGGFDQANPLVAGEDRMLSHSWSRRGWETCYEPTATVLHYHAQSMGSFLEMHHRYGRGARIFHRVNRVPASDLAHNAMSGFYLGLVSWPWRVRTPSPARTAALMILAQVAEVSGYLRELAAGSPLEGFAGRSPARARRAASDG